MPRRRGGRKNLTRSSAHMGSSGRRPLNELEVTMTGFNNFCNNNDVISLTSFPGEGADPIFGVLDGLQITGLNFHEWDPQLCDCGNSDCTININEILGQILGGPPVDIPNGWYSLYCGGGDNVPLVDPSAWIVTVNGQEIGGGGDGSCDMGSQMNAGSFEIGAGQCECTFSCCDPTFWWETYPGSGEWWQYLGSDTRPHPHCGGYRSKCSDGTGWAGNNNYPYGCCYKYFGGSGLRPGWDSDPFYQPWFGGDRQRGGKVNKNSRGNKMRRGGRTRPIRRQRGSVVQGGRGGRGTCLDGTMCDENMGCGGAITFCEDGCQGCGWYSDTCCGYNNCIPPTPDPKRCSMARQKVVMKKGGRANTSRRFSGRSQTNSKGKSKK